ncbi:Xaa-Pro dipeptidyl-peptidase [Lacticaseibacillus baoqingensis]|uniref:Xaa-Pro dipeptidyl-peptidase n=1 Tax=Lacticaseibacillus baoqingensis TaxID=2486013 RepID=A0ABW4E6H1_9LACO|nr:Xaa-Pro dipeptidyl-peptidase [Lacticaseibacillus baoqingensis]
MKLNQFARLTPAASAQFAELAAIGFDTDVNHTLVESAQRNLPLLFPEALTAQARADALARIAITPDQTLDQWLAAKPVVWPRETFYAVALQLLGFAPSVKELTQSLQTMHAAKLPTIAADIQTTADFLTALYLLLNTRTPKLVTYLDDLANRGFFQAPQSEAQPHYLFFNGKSQPVFDVHHVHREVVWIESDMDTDQDGQRDLLEATIFRPQATDSGLKMPVLFTADPYFHGTNPVAEATHVPDSQLAVKTASHQLADVTYHETPLPSLPKRPQTAETTHAAVYGSENGIYALNDYFLARGFATVYSGGVGTLGSDGLRSIGGRSETASAVAVIEWLAGKRRAFTDRQGTTAIKAWWCNGKIAMTGKSYLGTLAIAAATSGVDGLKTVISESAISSWYDYYRENGLVVAPGGFQGEDADVLAVDTFSRLKSAGEMIHLNTAWQKSLAAIQAGQDRVTGDYNTWWDERNYRNQVKNIRCDVVCVHGLNDTNVKPANVIKLWQAMRPLPIHKKLFLHQGQHVYLDNVRSLDFTDMMNLWLSFELLGVANHAPEQLPNVTVQDNLVPETWHTEDDFDAANQPQQKLNLAAEFAYSRASFADNATATFAQEQDDSASFEKAIIVPNSAYADSRLWLTLPHQTQPLTLEGTPHVTLKLWIDAPAAILSARLIDLGTANRFTPNASLVLRNGDQLGYDFKTQDIVEFGLDTHPTASKLISYGHLNLQNPTNAYTTRPITPGQPFVVDFDLQPTHYCLPADRQLALVIHGADMAQTLRPVAVVNYHLDLANSQLILPLHV